MVEKLSESLFHNPLGFSAGGNMYLDRNRSLPAMPGLQPRPADRHGHLDDDAIHVLDRSDATVQTRDDGVRCGASIDPEGAQGGETAVIPGDDLGLDDLGPGQCYYCHSERSAESPPSGVARSPIQVDETAI